MGENEDIDREPLVEELPWAEAQPGERRRRRGGFPAGLLLGVLTGIGVATLFSPLSGEQMRRRTAEKAPELWRRREDLAREAAQAARLRMREAVEAGREAAREAEDESRRRFERLTRRESGLP